MSRQRHTRPISTRLPGPGEAGVTVQEGDDTRNRALRREILGLAWGAALSVGLGLLVFLGAVWLLGGGC